MIITLSCFYVQWYTVLRNSIKKNQVKSKINNNKVNSLLDGLGVRAGDRVAIEECEELAESVEEGPVGEQTDALVGVDWALGCGAVGGCHRGIGGGGGGFVWILVQEAQLGALQISQTLLRVGLIELDGSTVHLKEGKSCDMSVGFPFKAFLLACCSIVQVKHQHNSNWKVQNPNILNFQWYMTKKTSEYAHLSSWNQNIFGIYSLKNKWSNQLSKQSRWFID